MLAPDVGLADLVTTPHREFLAPLGTAPSVYVAPREEDFHQRLPWLGAPSCAQPDADYRSRFPPGAVGLTQLKTQPIQDLSVTVRRWIAARLCRRWQAAKRSRSL